MTPEIEQMISGATALAFATSGESGPNVVPLSLVRVVDDTVWVFDFFMLKTVQNLQQDPRVALSCWMGYTGVQIHGTATYHDTGEVFAEAVTWAKEQRPDRTVRGVVVITPTELFDISAGATAGTKINK